MSKRQKLSCVQLEDLPNEVLLLIFKFLKMKELLKFGQVSKRIRAISNDESLWMKLNLFKGNVPYGFIEKAVENGCRYLSLAGADLNAVPEMPTLLLRNGKKVPKTTQIRYNLKYFTCSVKFLSTTRTTVQRELLKYCHSLQKLSLILTLSDEDVKHIIQNGKTLKVLDLRCFYALGLETNTKLIQNLIKKCFELSELNFSCIVSKQSEVLSAIVNNLSPNILKVDLGYNGNLEDSHVLALVKRCRKITELVLRCTSITNNSVDSIAKHSSLEKLDVSNTEIDSTALLQLGTIRTLKVLNCLKDKKIDENNIRKRLPQLSINKEDFFNIATSYRKYVSYFQDGLWEIKAKQQELLTGKIRT